MYRGQTLVWKLSFAFVPWQQKHYRRPDLSFLSPDSALSVKLLSSKEQLYSVGLSFCFLPSPVKSPGEGANGRNLATLLFLGIWFSMLGFLVPSPQLCCSACPQTLPKAFGRAGAVGKPWATQCIRKWLPRNISRESWMVRIHRGFSWLLNPAGNVTKLLCSSTDPWVNGRNKGDNSLYVVLVAGPRAVFLLFVAVLPMLTLVFGCVTLGELRHLAHPYGVAMADGSEAQEKL